MFIDGPVSDLPPSGQIATKLFKPEFLRVSEFLPQISALLNPGLGAAPVLFEKSNTALVTDSISNLQRVERLLQELDHPILEHNATKFYSLHAAKASDVVNQLRTLLAGPLQMQLGAATTYQADDPHQPDHPDLGPAPAGFLRRLDRQARRGGPAQHAQRG